jgi:glutaminyl-tRNA synthetase
MPTLAGLRRRGFTPEAIRDFSERIGVAKANSVVDLALLEHCVREDLNRRVPRVMAVLRPVRLVVENYPEGLAEEVEAVNNPEDPSMGARKVAFSRVLWVERDDVREVPPPKYFRLYPGNEVRLRYGYVVRCTGVVKDQRTGEIVEVRCTYDPASRGGNAGEGRRVKGTIHWVSAAHALAAEIRLYDRLFERPDPTDEADGRDFIAAINPASMEIVPDARVEPSLAGARPGTRYQFERLGYFCVDADTTRERLVLNRTVGLRDTWAKIERARGA